MNILIVSTDISVRGSKKPVNAIIDKTGSVILYNHSAEQILGWARNRFKPLPAEEQLDKEINCLIPGDILFLKDFQSTGPTPGTFFGLTLDTTPSDIIKAVLEQTAFYFYFLATEKFDISSHSTVTTAGRVFRYNSLCRILANIFNLTVKRLSKEGESTVEDFIASHPNEPTSLKSIQLNFSAKHTDKIFEPVKNSHKLFRDAYYRYLKIFGDISVYINALQGINAL